MQEKRRSTKKKLRDTLLAFEGGDEHEGEKKMIKAEKRKWETEKEENTDNFECAKELRSGVVRGRWCTDIICLVLFFAFIGAMGFCVFTGYSKGDTTRILAGIDGNDKFCGVDNGTGYNYEDYPYLYWPNFHFSDTGMPTSWSDIADKGMCVNKCPGDYGTTKPTDLACKGGDAAYCTGQDADKVGKIGVSHIYTTRTFVKYCIPKGTFTNEMARLMDDALNVLKGHGLGQYLLDVYNAGTQVGICIATSFAYCLVFIGLLSFFAEPLCWLCIVLIQLGLIGLPVLFGYKYWDNNQIKAGLITEQGATTSNAIQITELEDQGALYLTAAIGAGATCLCFAMCLWCFFDSIKLAIDVVDASADFVMCTKRILLVPFVYFILSVIIVIGWFVGYIMVMSMNKINATCGSLSPIPCGHQTQMKDVIYESENVVYMCIMWFGLIWSLIVVDYAKNFIVLFSASTYYFNSPKSELDDKGNLILDHEGDPKPVDPHEDGSAEVMLGVKYAHVSHLGSIAFGALIIAIIKVIRFLFVYLAKKALAASGQEDSAWGKVVKCLICVGDCILACLEKICDYINNAAFAYQAVTGDSFCTAAWNGFFLNLKHAAAFGSAKFMASALIFLGKAAITVLNVFTCFFMLKGMLGDDVRVDAPCIVVGIITWFLSEVWLTIFDQAILGIMTSYAIDYDLNGGKPCRGPDTFNNKRRTFEEKHAEHKQQKEAKRANSIQEGGQAMLQA